MKKLFLLLVVCCMTVSCSGEKKKDKVAADSTTPASAEGNENVAAEAIQIDGAETIGAAAEAKAAAEAALLSKVADVEANIAELKAEDINKRSYALGANMALATKFQFGDLNLDLNTLKMSLINFYENGKVDDPIFLENNNKFQGFIYTRFMPYMQAKQQRKVMEDAGVTEGLPELPTLYDETFTAEFIVKVLGSQMGASLIDVDGIDLSWFFKGFADGLAVESPETIEGSLLLTMDEMQAELMGVQREMIEKAEVKAQQKGVEAKERSAAWLADIEKMEGVKKTESGLLYRIERKGNGEFPTADTDRVTVHYEGTLSNGTVFDSSYERGETITFGLSQVIKGWTEGLKLIDKGGEITLWIPSDLAYGERGAGGGSIGPNEALKFKVELYGINE